MKTSCRPLDFLEKKISIIISFEKQREAEILTKIEFNFLKITDVDSIERELQNFFSKSSTGDWKKIAMQETNGKDPFESLSWRGNDELFFLPYYDSENDADLSSIRGFQLPAAKLSAPRSWLNIPPVKISKEQTANASALQHLLHGADGVLFDTRTTRTPDLNTLTNKIQWPSCSIQFYAASDSDLINTLPDFITKNNISPASVTGGLFWESIPKKSNFDFYLHNCQNFRALGLLIEKKSPAREIADALIQGASAFEIFSAHHKSSEVFRAVSFSLSTDESFLECVAKFKALRMLWFQIARAYGLYDYKNGDVHIHARSEAISGGPLFPHQNMIKGTFCAMAAILGGCSSLSVEPDGDAPFISRWAKNVSLILQEESFFGQTADPLAGAWALETITHAIAEKAWKQFQQMWTTHAAT